MLALLFGVAFGACGDAPPVPDTLAVAWVSPLGKHVSGASWLPLVTTADLRAFAAKNEADDYVRTLQWLGLRSSARPPQRRYKVVVFDVSRESLCRPVGAGEPSGDEVRRCEDERAAPRAAHDGCGYLTDLRTETPSAPVFSARWEDVSADGFCVLPLERFLEAAEKAALRNVSRRDPGPSAARPPAGHR